MRLTNSEPQKVKAIKAVRELTGWNSRGNKSLWHDVEDDTVRSEILQKYMENNRPDCMEVVE